MKCPYCGKEAHQLPTYYICYDCDATVGCHPNGAPLGTLADAQTRVLRIQAHEVFAALRVYYSKRKIYSLLSKRMKLSPKKCHIAMFDASRCLEAIGVLKELLKEKDEFYSRMF